MWAECREVTRVAWPLQRVQMGTVGQLAVSRPKRRAETKPGIGGEMSVEASLQTLWSWTVWRAEWGGGDGGSGEQLLSPPSSLSQANATRW